MASNYDDRAAQLQRGVKQDEIRSLETGFDDYDSPAVRQAIVHTRQNAVLLVSHLSLLNRQLATNRRLVWVGFLLGAVAALRYLGLV